MAPSTIIAAVLLALGVSAAPQGSASLSAAAAPKPAACSGSFNKVSAQTFFSALNPGWNLGNTLDAIPTETSWGNPLASGQTFDDIKAAGFKGLRLPVTWAYHFVDGTDNTGTSPNWTVDATWLSRVSDVVDLAVSRGLYTLVNVHHDSWVWADVTQANANYTLIEEKFYRLWYQIGTKLACKSSLVAFEPINEPPGTTQAHADEINKLNTLFLKALTDSGGFNPQRVVTLVGPGMDSIKTSQFFKTPSPAPTNPWGIQYHYYSPYDFIFMAWGKTIWGSDADKATVQADLTNIRNNFTNVPLLIGEYSASSDHIEPAGARKYTDYLVRTARSLNTQTVLWDNGGDFFDRVKRVWRDPSVPAIIKNAAAGTPNSLADSTTDASATTQNSSAYIFQKVGQAVSAQSLPFLLNGNTFSSATNEKGSKLSSSDVKASGSSITFSASLLQKYFTSSAKPGILGNISVAFSKGAAQTVTPVLWDTPVLGSTSSKASGGADLHIPVTWKGIPKLAAVRVVYSDGTFAFDDWTQYLGPLQQARSTYSNQFSWDANSVIITAAAAQAVASAGKSATFTFEFWPRVPGNSANYTLTV